MGRVEEFVTKAGCAGCGKPFGQFRLRQLCNDDNVNIDVMMIIIIIIHTYIFYSDNTNIDVMIIIIHTFSIALFPAE